MLEVIAVGARRRNFFLKALRTAAESRAIDVAILGCDTDNLDPFSVECDRFSIIPPIATDEGRTALLSLIRPDTQTLIFGWNDAEISTLVDLLGRYPSGCDLALPERRLVALMHDKARTKEWAISHSIRVPERLTSAQASITRPIVVKPRLGQGAVGVHVCRNEHAARAAIMDQAADYIIEEFVYGPEYTVDVVAYSGECIAAVPRRRLKVRGGEVMIAQVEMRLPIMALARKICSALNISGVFNFQVIESADELYLLEMNPRFGGGSDLTISAGVDLAGAYLDIFFLKRCPPKPIAITDRLIMTRRFESSFRLPKD